MSQTDTVGSLHQDVYNILKTGHVKFLVGKLNISQNHTVKEQEAQDKFLQSCGRYRHDIIPDGNSLYRAVAESFYGDQSGHLSLRQQTLSYIKSVGTCHLNIKGKPHHFFSRASQLGDWTKVTEIAALSYILHVNIHVLTCDKDCIIPPKFKPCHFGGPETTRDIYISWLSTGHFDAITDERKPNPEYSQWFQQQLSSNKLCVVQESDINKSCSANEIQTPSMTETQTRSGIYEFNAVLHDVANELGQDEFQQLLLLCKGIIPKSRSENLWNCMDLFQTLEDQGLISRRDASFLIELLTEIKRMDLVEKVRTHHPGSLADGISWIKTHLRKKYKKHYRNFKPIPWNENMSLSLTKLYTRLKVTKSNERKRFKKGKILTNEKAIFGKKGLHEDFARIQIEGAPGMGKSTLCRKLAYDWACGELPQYQLLFLLEMRHVSENSHQLERIIFDQLLPDKAEITLSALVKFINQNQSSVLFLFDGLDEMKFRSNVDSSVIKTIQQKQFPWCTVVTTTRPHECDNVLMESDVQFMVEGFSLQDAMKYIEKYFNNNESKAQSLISELKLDKVPLHRSPLPYLRAYMDDSNGYTNDDTNDDDDDDDDNDNDTDDDDTDDNCTFDRHSLKFTHSHAVGSSSFYDMRHSGDDDVYEKIVHTGYLDEHIQHLTEKVPRNVQRHAEDFHTQHDLLCNPLHVAFVCLLWEDKRFIPTNMTNTYSEILECILRRCCCKSGIEMPSGEIPKKVQDDVNCLASLAFKAVVEKNMILNETDVPSTLLSLGLLVRDTGVSNIKPEKLCFFYHKTWLEYFAALHFCNNVNENVNDMKSTFKDFALNAEQVGLFVAGILKDKAKSLLPVLGNKLVNKYWYHWESGVCSDFSYFFQFTCAFCHEAGLAVESLIKYMPDILILSDMMKLTIITAQSQCTMNIIPVCVQESNVGG
ncbi:uncharacterized protein [Ptychodera flava]|uniref:uncharacterized protein n=1 Tax=Ptychodera flava TaxID=63121 RepID=UPI00396A8828